MNASNLVDGYTIARIADLAATTSGNQSSGPVQTIESQQSCPSYPEAAADNHKVVAVGAGVGLGVGVPLLAALAGTLLLLRKEKKASASKKMPMAQSFMEGGNYSIGPHQRIGQPRQELDDVKQPAELSNAG